MKQKLLYLVSLLLISLCGKAQENNSLVWKISGKNLKEPSFLVGTIHMICSDDYFFPEKMEAAFAKTNQLILEADLSNEENNAKLQHSLLLDNQDKSLKAILKEEDYPLLEEYLSSHNIKLEEFEMLKPFALLSAITLNDFNCDRMTSYEEEIMNMSIEKPRPIVGLESPEYQLSLFDSLSNEEMRTLLMSHIKQDTPNEEMGNNMVSLYKSENIDELYKLIISSPEYKNHVPLFLSNRNKNWMKKLPALMETKSSYIAVGAGHLGGKDGLIALLKKAGYTVEPLK
ncbi:MAG: TraB/GumN family protein [Chitinophagaceae bacterium]